MAVNKREEIINFIVDNLDNTDYFVGKLVHLLYSDKYCMTNDGGKDKWFVFNDNHWRTSASIKHELKNKLSEEVTNYLSGARTKIRNEYADIDDSLMKETIQKHKVNQICTLHKLENKLYNTTYKDRILKECESLFFVNELPSR